MQTYFKLHNKPASYFDLISGAKEPKQTKGLALTLATDDKLLEMFLAIPSVANAIKSAKPNCKQNWISRVTLAEITAEHELKSKRVDILIKIDVDHLPFVILAIEAKSIALSANFTKAQAQVTGYISLLAGVNQYSGYAKVGMVLANHTMISNSCPTLLWADVIDILHKRSMIKPVGYYGINYLQFLKRINVMKCYEVEVLTVPAGRTYNFIIKHRIYTCSDSRTDHKLSLFLAFRQNQNIRRSIMSGQMDALYRIEDIIVLKPGCKISMATFASLKHPRQQAVFNYIADIKQFGPKSIANDFNNATKEIRFYLLSDCEIILTPKKYPQKNLQIPIHRWKWCDFFSNKPMLP